VRVQAQLIVSLVWFEKGRRCAARRRGGQEGTGHSTAELSATIYSFAMPFRISDQAVRKVNINLQRIIRSIDVA
jgi:hypothetical protein